MELACDCVDDDAAQLLITALGDRDEMVRMEAAKVIDEFEAVYANVNHRVSRYGEAGFIITELGLIATADKVKPVLLKRPLGASNPAAANKGVRYTSGSRPAETVLRR